STGIRLTDGETVMLVAVIDFEKQLAGVYVNPTGADYWDATGGSADATRVYTNGNWSTAVRLASGGEARWDNLRVTRDWASLDFGVPEPMNDVVTMRLGDKARVRVLGNDSGSLDARSVQVVVAPTAGTAVVSSEGSILYEQTTGSPASDFFTYEVSGNDPSETATATVMVNFTSDYRFDSNYTNVPEEAPATQFAVEGAFPGLSFDLPHGFASIPGDTEKLLVAESDGEVILIPDVTANPTDADKVTILDIRSQITEMNEASLKGIAVHPDWANNGYIYVTYDSNQGTVRLSRFTCTTSAPYSAGSELVLIDQVVSDSIHTIATCQFGADGYLYVGFGDEGTQEDGYDNSQHIDQDFWSSVIRIDVDKKAGNLVPNADADIPRVGGGTSGEAYFSVPADNPFVGATLFNGVGVAASEVRTEIFVLGVRNPWQFSPEDVDGDGTVDELWVGDVGRGVWEELNVFEPGENGGWAWREGPDAGVRSGDVINGAIEGNATLTEARWFYGHGGGSFTGNSITGGYIHRGDVYPGLDGFYICGDFSIGNIWAIDERVSDPTPGAGIVRLGGANNIVGFLPDPATGEILVLNRNGWISRITASVDDSDFPATLSDTNFFADLSDLTANPGAEFYEPNLRFWSDHAEKKRWFLIEDATQEMTFAETGPWSYPAGMVWVKHFEYAREWETFTRQFNGQNYTDRRPVMNSPVTRLETRFLVKTTSGAYGVSYRWNHVNGGEQTEANLADVDGETFDVDIQIDGQPATVSWEIPSRSACLVCHTAQAGHSLSFHTMQLNRMGEISGVPGNLLESLRAAGYVTGMSGDAAERERHLRPDETAYSLEARVRSYLEVNCAYCHKSGGTGGGSWDGRAHLTLAQTGLVSGVSSDAPLNAGDLLVKPGLVNASILYNRLAVENGYTRMPPLASRVVDLEGAELLSDWIEREVQAVVSYDEWRMFHFGDLVSAEGERAANPDGDSGDNEFEWLTNTLPLDGESVWEPEISVSGGDVTLNFEPLGNRRMRAMRSHDLEDWMIWEVPGNEGIPLNPESVGTLSGSGLGERQFFRFEIEER
ncbi:MAG: PQQ-dependent sugar dehydrogenase, partial [Verrucomicrobiota bacterium]